MRATDLKPSRKVSNGQGVPRVDVTCEIPSYLQRYENERAAWMQTRTLRHAR